MNKDGPSIIKIPQKFCDAGYETDVKKKYIQFDLAHVSIINRQ